MSFLGADAHTVSWVTAIRFSEFFPTKVAALNLLRQGLSVAPDSDHVTTKRKLEENKDLEVPTTSNKKQLLGGDCTAVPDST